MQTRNIFSQATLFWKECGRSLLNPFPPASNTGLQRGIMGWVCSRVKGKMKKMVQFSKEVWSSGSCKYLAGVFICLKRVLERPNHVLDTQCIAEFPCHCRYFHIHFIIQFSLKHYILYLPPVYLDDKYVVIQITR